MIYKKIIEETPSPEITDDLHALLRDAAIRVCTLVKHRSAGTIEFVYDRTSHEFHFPEVNCRLQVIKKKNFFKI
jgi:acetyl/propionyl-CoA carboxylase alpha subunit